MLPAVRMNHLQSCIVNVIKEGIPGDVIETGVWRGGATIFMRGILKAFDVRDRCVWVADSFEGLPLSDAEKFPLEAKAHAGPFMTKVCNHLAVGIDEVRRNFDAYGLLDDQVRFLKGWFCDTLPTAPIERLALMRLDGDLYDSTRDSLVNLFHRLSPGGYVIIDDYGEDSWTYCRRAVDEFRAERGISDPLIRVDSRGATTGNAPLECDPVLNAVSLISLDFAAFVAMAALLYHLSPRGARSAVLCAVSMVFCALNSVASAVALLIATAIAYWAAHWIHKAADERRRQILLTAAVVIALSAISWRSS